MRELETEESESGTRVRQVRDQMRSAMCHIDRMRIEGSDWSRTASQMSQVHILRGFTAALQKFQNISMKDFPATSHTSCGDVISRSEQFLYARRDGAG